MHKYKYTLIIFLIMFLTTSTNLTLLIFRDMHYFASPDAYISNTKITSVSYNNLNDIFTAVTVHGELEGAFTMRERENNYNILCRDMEGYITMA